MTRAAIYARFSSDLQRDRSIDDQIALCRDYAARNGYQVAAVYSDRAMTGATMHQRTGLKALLEAARGRTFEFVLAESMSRIGRDQEDRAGVRKRLSFAGIQIVTPADGVVAPLVDGIRAVIDQAQLEDMKNAVRRGMAGAVRDGRNAGGRPYGYRIVRKFDDRGEPVRGLLEIDEAQAAIVRRIFAEYIEGTTAREIAARLNAEAVPPPRRAFWRGSTIYGNAVRGTGILQNRLYAGEIVWNRGQTPRDPDTHQRIRRAKPEAEWHRKIVPQLRIVDDATFAAAAAARAQRSQTRPNVRKAPKRVLSGLLRCGTCGAGMSIKDHDHGRPRIQCSQHKEAGRCDHKRVYYLDTIERLVVGGLKTRLGSRQAIARFITTYNAARLRDSAQAVRDRARKEQHLAAAERQIDRTVKALIEERISDEEADRQLPALRAERDTLKAALAQLAEPPKVIALHPAAVAAYLRDLDRLAETINQDLRDHDPGLATAIRSMVETVTVLPTRAGIAPRLELRGRLERLLDLAAADAQSLSGVGFGAGSPIAPHPPISTGFVLRLGSATA